MKTQMKYMPIFRVRQEEIKVLRRFDFGHRMFPCLEILKEHIRETDRGKKSFEETHLELIASIKSLKVFVDLPVHYNERGGGKKKDAVINFVRGVVGNREKRTEYMIKLVPAADRIIPVISTYFNRTSERKTILLQESALRPYFKQLAFRTFPESFERDIAQIKAAAKRNDYLIVDLGTEPPDSEEEAFSPTLDTLRDFTECEVVILRSAVNTEVRNVDLHDGKVVPSIDNSLINLYQEFYASAFGDYAGIKKDNVTTGGGQVSPGFIYYDATSNRFYGYKGRIKHLDEFKNHIVPAVIASKPTLRMRRAALAYLDRSNMGWQLLQDILSGTENGRSMAKFKRISMEHYLACIQKRIDAGDFDS
ncbi:MAG: hypothetical protein JWN76_480 [Chitinophagaceae bacterium]|nr:hypothetical protein [Chitinophagaceae bacterium]